MFSLTHVFMSFGSIYMLYVFLNTINFQKKKSNDFLLTCMLFIFLKVYIRFQKICWILLDEFNTQTFTFYVQIFISLSKHHLIDFVSSANSKGLIWSFSKQIVSTVRKGERNLLHYPFIYYLIYFPMNHVLGHSTISILFL